MKPPTARELNDSNLLLAEASDIARQRLEETRACPPFAVALDQQDRLVQIDLEPPEGGDAFEALLRVVRQRVTGEGYRAVAIVRDARVRAQLPEGARGDAIVIVIEHVFGYAVQCFVPHTFHDAGRLTLGTPRVVPAVHSIY
jgi:hypothetical protein